MAELVSIDGYTLSPAAREGEWKVLRVSGWWERPGKRSKSSANSRGHGSYAAASYFEDRRISITGRISCKSHANLHEAANLLMQAGAVEVVPFVVQGHGPSQQAFVEADGQPSLVFETDTYMTFELSFVARDPRRYGEETEFEASVGADKAVFHRGNFAATPYIKVSGSMPGGYTLTLAGSNVVVTEPLTSGVPHSIDYETGLLYKGNQVAHGGMSTASFADVLPGQRDTFSIAPGTSGEATATMYLSDTYM